MYQLGEPGEDFEGAALRRAEAEAAADGVDVTVHGAQAQTDSPRPAERSALVGDGVEQRCIIPGPAPGPERRGLLRPFVGRPAGQAGDLETVIVLAELTAGEHGLGDLLQGQVGEVRRVGLKRLAADEQGAIRPVASASMAALYCWLMTQLP